MELFKHSPDRFGYRQAEMGSIFQHTHAFVTQVKENGSRSQNAAVTDYIYIKDIRYSDENKNKELFEYTSEAHRAG